MTINTKLESFHKAGQVELHDLSCLIHLSVIVSIFAKVDVDLESSSTLHMVVERLLQVFKFKVGETDADWPNLIKSVLEGFSIFKKTAKRIKPERRNSRQTVLREIKILCEFECE